MESRMMAIIGDQSKPPIGGSTRRIGPSTGSVTWYRNAVRPPPPVGLVQLTRTRPRMRNVYTVASRPRKVRNRFID
jgi:hypothetical protein